MRHIEGAAVLSVEAQRADAPVYPHTLAHRQRPVGEGREERTHAHLGAAELVPDAITLEFPLGDFDSSLAALVLVMQQQAITPLAREKPDAEARITVQYA